MSIYRQILEGKFAGKKHLAVLLDPDKLGDDDDLKNIMGLINSCNVDLVFVGGSLVINKGFEKCVKKIKESTNAPVILFPGSVNQITSHVDAMLLLSLISGRNAELLIGQHVIAAPAIREAGIETISTGYMLVDCGSATTASYISGTLPVPYNKPEIAGATALAGEMLGLSCMYLDGGSGADQPVSQRMIATVRDQVSCPLIVGGGIRSEAEANSAWQAGADVVVIGTAFEENPDLLLDIAAAKSSL